MSGATAAAVAVVPANAASWRDLMTVFGSRGEPAKCLCQRMRLPHRAWHDMPVSARAERLRAQTRAGEPEAATTSGLVACLGGEPAGWCAVAPRPEYLRLQQPQATVPWAGRDEDRADPTVWAVACFATRAGFRRRGVSGALAAAAVDFARSRGARALEGYPMIVEPGRDRPMGRTQRRRAQRLRRRRLPRGRPPRGPPRRDADRLLDQRPSGGAAERRPPDPRKLHV